MAVLWFLLAGGTARAELTLERVGLYVPLEPAFVNVAPIFMYIDVEAFQRSARFAAVTDDGRRWGGIVGLPIEAAPVPQFVGPLQAATGLDTRTLRRVLALGQPPDTVLVLSGTPALAEPAALDAALGRRDFARIAEQGWAIWHMGEDHMIQLQRREPDDPFGGQFGRSARIAVRNGEVIGTAAWAPLRRVLAAVDGRGSSLAGVAEFAAALHGIDDAARREAMVVIQAAGFHVGHTGLVPVDPAALLEGDLGKARAALLEQMRRAASAELLPPYLFAVLGDLAGREREGAVIALAYSDKSAAAQVVPVLARRLAVHGAPGALAERNAAINSRVVVLPREIDGRRAWAVVATATYAMEPQRLPAYRDWIAAIFNRDFRMIALDGG